MSSRSGSWKPFALVACVCACTAASACDAVLPRLQIGTVAVPAETLTVVAAPNVFSAATSQAAAPPSRVDAADSAEAPAHWSSGDQRIAQVNQLGMVVGRAPGSTVVGASREGRWAFTAVQVVPSAEPRIEVIAHRGFMRRFPENTMVAVKGAFDLGADAVEVDIRLNAEGVPFVMHDSTVDRTTNGHGAVAAMTSAELSALNACARWANVPACPVPPMTDVLREAHGRGGVLLHLYGNYTMVDLEKLLAAVRDADMDRQTVFICFDYPVLTALRQLDPVVGLALLTTSIPDPKAIDALGRAASLVDLQAAIKDSTLTRGFIRAATQQQQEVGAWAPWTQAQAQQAVALGFRYLIADVPIDRATLTP